MSQYGNYTKRLSQINFVLIGVGGYIAPRHLAAIKAVGGNLLAALDKHDSVGVLDSYFPDCDFFTEFEVFERHCSKLQQSKNKIDYVVVCSPNYLHDAHCRFGLRIGADVICEKPLCLNPDNAYDLQVLEAETGRRVWNILQLRLHPEIIKLKDNVDLSSLSKVKLQYITARGNWYHHSWKGDKSKSGGLLMNIGIHFFDMLCWIYGPTLFISGINSRDAKTNTGILYNEQVHVQYLLSIDVSRSLVHELGIGQRSSRALFVNGELILFTDGFTDLHTESYKEILAGRGFGIEDALPALKLVHQINNF